MRLELPPLYTQAFLFRSVDEAGVFRLAGDQNKYEHWSVRKPIEAKVRFFDTPEGLHRQNGIELTERAAHAHGIHFGAREMHVYTSDNIWQTQSRRMLGGRHPQGITPSFIELSPSELEATTNILEVTEYYDEWLLCTRKKIDIGLHKIAIPEAGLEYLSIFHTNVGLDLSHSEDHSTENIVVLERRNYIGMLAFLNEAVKAGFIAPLLETPHDTIVKAQQNRLQN